MDFEQIITNIYPIDEKSLAVARSLLTPATIRKGELIMHQDKVCQSLFIIRSGVFRNFVIYDGKDITRWFAEDGDIFTSMVGFAYREPSIASVEALCDAEIYTAPIDDVRRLIDTSTAWSVWANHFVFDGLAVMEKRYKYLGQGDAYTRFKNLYKWRRAEVIMHIPLQHIASYLNVSPQTISRFRRKIAAEMKGAN